VVFCACYKDKTLKHRSDWCEWCQCKNCGGKSIPKDTAAAYGYESAKNSDSAGEFNVDLGLLVLLLSSVVVIVAYLSPTNSYVLACGLVAACYLFRDISYVMFFKKPSAASSD
jgi:hypothetical protein